MLEGFEQNVCAIAGSSGAYLELKVVGFSRGEDASSLYESPITETKGGFLAVINNEREILEDVIEDDG